MTCALAPKVNLNTLTTIMLSLDCLIPIEESLETNTNTYEIIGSKNIHIFKQQNSLLFPVTYPDSFYRNVLSSLETSAYLGNHLWAYIILL